MSFSLKFVYFPPFGLRYRTVAAFCMHIALNIAWEKHRKIENKVEN